MATHCRLLFWALVGILFQVSSAMAGVVITGTRLIYPQGQKEITVKLNNNGQHPALVQAWVDEGSVESSPTRSGAPFVLLPPVARIDPNKGQSLRLMYTGPPLAQDRESVFWFNVLEIPPKKDHAADANVLQMAFRTRIKIFYRPETLTGNPAQAAERLQWRIKKAEQGGYTLEGYNPTEFHVSQVGLTLNDGSEIVHIDSGMINPGQMRQFHLPHLKSRPSPAAQIKFTSINDHGALIPVMQSLNP